MLNLNIKKIKERENLFTELYDLKELQFVKKSCEKCVTQKNVLLYLQRVRFVYDLYSFMWLCGLKKIVITFNLMNVYKNLELEVIKTFIQNLN